MKLINFLEDKAFNSLRQKMGASLKSKNSFKPYIHKTTEEEYNQITQGGLESDDIEKVIILKDGTLAYNGEVRGVIYIRDIFDLEYHDKEIHDRDGNFTLRKFHISGCHTFEKHKAEGKIKRFVFINTEDDRNFTFNIKRMGKWEPHLEEKPLVCKNCLSRIKWEDEKPNNFKLREFFEKYLNKNPSTLIPKTVKNNSIFAPLQDYTPHFQEIQSVIKVKLIGNVNSAFLIANLNT